MSTFKDPAGDVHVNDYERERFGKREHVREHTRGRPRRTR